MIQHPSEKRHDKRTREFSASYFSSRIQYSSTEDTRTWLEKAQRRRSNMSFRRRIGLLTSTAICVAITCGVASFTIPLQSSDFAAITRKHMAIPNTTPYSISNTQSSLVAPLFMARHREDTSTMGGPSDEAEWRALLAAFKMYKTAYGDLKVPSRFIVPSMPPWPGKSCHSPLAFLRKTQSLISHLTTKLSSNSHRKRLGYETRSTRGGHSFDWKICAK
jgi:hypothetical protein